MKPSLPCLLAAFLMSTGCSNSDAPIQTSPGKLTQTRVDAIIVDCGGPRGMAKIEGAKLVIQPVREVAITGCVLRALQATGETALSAVDNQRYDPPNSF